MGMQNYPAKGLVIEATNENIRKLDLGEAGEKFIALIEEHGIDEVYSTEEMGEEFFEAFYDKYGFTPSFDQIQDEADGCDGVEPGKFYFVFDESDKYIKAINPKWKVLASKIEPEEASWCVWG